MCSIAALYDFDFDSQRAQLEMSPDTILTYAIEGGLMVSPVASAMNVTPVTKAPLSKVHKLFKLSFTIPISSAIAERS